ncbi:MAG: hypothetical protein AVDCRST_MAG38-227 [uncultured Solirubrobacteraceae bacterium]|uniref:Biopolymer transporter Tol n=1 Tax=uncultured Solirubrobacteraceae bacterium TaxID=1162706 RepID=A0A6J4R7D3_9ACTN|nr:MAG: hypothetical protein AVDCRST_MAG38-227 [uncultured Solirubrobacteraceae bacterium]
MPERTPDGHYVVIDGRRWRATDPSLPEERRQELVSELMSARRAVGAARRAGDSDAEQRARARVHAAKVGLGERGPKWWERRGNPPAAAGDEAPPAEADPPGTP